MYVFIWFNRLTDGRSFELAGVKMEIPKECAKHHYDAQPNRLVQSFKCAIGPKKFEAVDIGRSIFPTANDIYKSKPYVEKFSENKYYFYIVTGQKQGSERPINYYEFKSQNLTVESESNDLAKKFVDEILRNSFRIQDNSTPDR